MRRLIIALATGLYTGYVPFAPGTLGSLWGLPGLLLLGLVARRSVPTAAIAVAAFCCAAVWLAHRAEHFFEEHDSSKIVIDEVAGMIVAGFLMPVSLKSLSVCFLLFRFFDIVKPPPVRWLDQRVSGGLGIVADDLAAGVYANLVARLLLW